MTRLQGFLHFFAFVYATLCFCHDTLVPSIKYNWLSTLSWLSLKTYSILLWDSHDFARHLSYPAVTGVASLHPSCSLASHTVDSRHCCKGFSPSFFLYYQIPRLDLIQMLPLDHHYFYYVTHICVCCPKCLVLIHKSKTGNVCMYGQNFRVKEKRVSGSLL